MADHVFEMAVYREKARMTMVCPEDKRPSYVRFGLMGEVGELANKLKKVWRGDYGLLDIREALCDEMGDILWYIALLTLEFDHYFTPEVLLVDCLAEQADNRPTNIFEAVDNIIAWAGDLYLIDRIKNPTPKEIEVVQGAFECLIVNMYCACGILHGQNLNAVSDANLVKLASRANRGQIKGTGDKR